MWLAIHWVYCCTLFQFLYWSTRWVCWEYLVIPGSVHEHQKNWVLSHLLMQHLCKLPLAFPIPILVSRSYPLSCSLVSIYCPSCGIISLIFLTREVLPDNNTSLQHRQHLSRKANLVFVSSYTTQCSSSCSLIVVAHAVSAKNKAFQP